MNFFLNKTPYPIAYYYLFYHKIKIFLSVANLSIYVSNQNIEHRKHTFIKKYLFLSIRLKKMFDEFAFSKF